MDWESIGIAIACLAIAASLWLVFKTASEPPKSGIDWDKEKRTRPFRPRSMGSPLTVLLFTLLLVGCGATDEHENLKEVIRLDDKRKELEEKERRMRNEALAKAALEVRELRKENKEALKGVERIIDDIRGWE